jgi:hypothetical protein
VEEEVGLAAEREQLDSSTVKEQYGRDSSTEKAAALWGSSLMAQFDSRIAEAAAKRGSRTAGAAAQ